MISAITNDGKLRYHFYRGKFNQALFISFLKRIIKGTDKKVFTIADNSSVHHGLTVKEWKEENAESISVFYFTMSLAIDVIIRPVLKPQLNTIPKLCISQSKEIRLWYLRCLLGNALETS